MGDRTTTNTTIAASDLAAVRRLLLGEEECARGERFDDETPNGDGTITVTQYDINWGGEYDADALVRAGIPFIIRHDSGGSYEAGWIVFDGVNRDSRYGSADSILVAFDIETGEPEASDLAHAKAFLALKARTEALLVSRNAAAQIHNEQQSR